MASPREEAEYFRVALSMGLVEKDAAIAWADRMIMALENPPIEVIEVSLAGNKPPDEIMGMLASIPGQGDLTLVAHQVLWLFRQRLDAGEIPLESAVEMLGAYHSCAVVPEDESLAAYNFSEFLYCAQNGLYGTLESVREEIDRFLARHMSGPISP